MLTHGGSGANLGQQHGRLFFEVAVLRNQIFSCTWARGTSCSAISPFAR